MGRSVRQRTVREILLEMKDRSELAVSLAYAAVMYNDEEIADEVLELENKLDELRYELSVRAIVAGRSFEEAEELAAILEVGAAADEISDAVADLAKIVLKGYPLHESISAAFMESEEVIGLVRLTQEAPLIGVKIAELYDPEKLAGCDILAVKRDGRWLFDYPDDLVLKEGDMLLLEGTREGVDAVRSLLGLPSKLRPSAGVEVGEASRELAHSLQLLRAHSELMVYLAYAAMLMNSQAVALEVSRLEDEIDDLHEEFELKVLTKLSGRVDPRAVIGLLRAASAAERIGDAAHRMASVVERGVPAHEVLAVVVEESEESIVWVRVKEGSPADGVEIGKLSLEESSGMEILAVRRGLRWIFEPRDSFRVREGDILILLGPPDGLETALKILGAEEID